MVGWNSQSCSRRKRIARVAQLERDRKGGNLICVWGGEVDGDYHINKTKTNKFPCTVYW